MTELHHAAFHSGRSKVNATFGDVFDARLPKLYLRSSDSELTSRDDCAAGQGM